MKKEGNQKQYWEDYKLRRRRPEHPAVEALFEPRARYLQSLIGNQQDGSVLDVGCGNGFLTYYLEKVFDRVVGLDSSSAMLEINPCQEKVCGSVTALPFDDNSFDIVVESHLLHHLTPETVPVAIREMMRVSKSHVVLYEPNRNNPLMYMFARLVPEEHFALKFCRKYVSSHIEKAGGSSHSSRLEGTLVPNKTPAPIVPLCRFFNDTFLAATFGFYMRHTIDTNG
jgi:SAM-dependent methyltransferase